MIFDLQKHGFQGDLPELPQYEDVPPAPDDSWRTAGIERQRAQASAICASVDTAEALDLVGELRNDGANRSRIVFDAEPSLLRETINSGASSASPNLASCTSLVQQRVKEFQSMRALEKHRTLTNIARVALSSLVLGFVFYMLGSVWYILDGSRILYYALTICGIVLFGFGILLLSTCLEFDAFSTLDSHPYLRMSLCFVLILALCLYAVNPPHLFVVGIIPAGMLLMGFVHREETPRWAFTTSLLSVTMLSFDLGFAAIFFHCCILSVSDNMSDYCLSWTEGDMFFFLEACWTMGGLMYSTIYYACRWCFSLDSDTRAVVTWRILHAMFVIHGFTWLLAGVGKFAAGSRDHGVGQSCVGFSWLMPAAIISGVGSKRFFKFASHAFEDRQANKDSAFMAMLLDDGGVAVGQKWWIRDEEDTVWSCGEVLRVTDSHFTVRVINPLRSSATEAKTSSRKHSFNIFAQISSRSKGSSVASMHTKGSSVASMHTKGSSVASKHAKRMPINSVEHVLPLAGRHLSALQLLNSANASLRCIDWRAMSLELLNETSCGGKVEGSFELSRPLNASERIDFFLSHSWHDDPVLKWSRLREVAEKFFQACNRYPTFWLDKVCIDQSNLADGLKVLPIYIMSCRRVLALVGDSYSSRLWCVWELFTIFAFADEEHALGKVRLIPLGSGSEDDMFDSLLAFDSSLAECFDPNEELRLQRIIDTVGRAHFETCIRRLSRKCMKASKAREHSKTNIDD